MKKFLFFLIAVTAASNILAGSDNGKKNATAVNNLDTIAFDLCNLVPKGDTVQFPVYFLSDDTIDALDFSMRFDTLKLTFLTIKNLKPSYLFPTFYLDPSKVLRFTSYSSGSQDFQNNTALVSVMFLSNTGVIGASDLTITLARLNGDACSDKLIDTNCVAKVGVEELINQRSLKIYPNPSANETTLQFKVSESTKMNISISDILGKKVKDVYNGVLTAGEQQFKIETAGFKPGVYFVNFSTDKTIQTKKLIITR